MDDSAHQRPVPRLAAERAALLVQPGMRLGIGTGRAARAFIEALGQRARDENLGLRCVPTSTKSEALLTAQGLPTATLEDCPELDLAVDGADEVVVTAMGFPMIKGLGGALVRERFVARAARQFVVLVGSDKVTTRLGARGVLPIEVVPFGWRPVERDLLCISSIRSLIRREDPQRLGTPFCTDNGNWILDAAVDGIDDPANLEASIASVFGVVGSGLFSNEADVVLVDSGDGVETYSRDANAVTPTEIERPKD